MSELSPSGQTMQSMSAPQASSSFGGLDVFANLLLRNAMADRLQGKILDQLNPDLPATPGTENLGLGAVPGAMTTARPDSDFGGLVQVLMGRLGAGGLGWDFGFGQR